MLRAACASLLLLLAPLVPPAEAQPAQTTSAAAPVILTGRVVDERSAGLPGVRVSLVDLPWDWEPGLGDGGAARKEPAELVGAMTDERGMFVIDASAVPRGFHPLRIDAPPRKRLIRHQERFAVGQGPLPRDLVVSLLPPVTLEGIVLDSRGKPTADVKLAGVFESASGSAHFDSASGSDGRFTVPGLPALAHVRLRAEHAGALDVTELRLPAEGSARIAFHLEDPLEIAGRLAGAGAGPLAGARILVLASSSETIALGPWRPVADPGLFVVSEHVSAADGSFRVRMAPRARAVVAQPGWAMQELQAGHVSLRRETAIQGSVVDAAGKPVSGALARLGRVPLGATSDASGAFLLPVGLPDMRLVAPTGAEISAPSRGGNLRIRLPSEQRVAGRVVTRPAERAVEQAAEPAIEPVPIPHATLRFVIDDRWQALAAAGASGSFDLVLPQAASRGRASTPVLGGWFEIPADRPALDLVANAGLAMSLNVRLRASGSPARNALLLAREEDLPGSAHLARADGLGLAEVTFPAGRPLRLEASAAFAQPDDVVLTPQASLAGAKDIALPAASRLLIGCLDEAGSPLEGCRVEARASSLGRQARAPMARGPFGRSMLRSVLAGSDSSGVATFDGMAVGECVHVVARRPGRSPATLECARAAPAGATARFDLRLPKAASISGIVRDPSGEPVASASVSAREDSSTVETGRRGRFFQAARPLATTMSDASGAYELRDLAEGRVEIVASADGFQDSETVPVDLATGEQGQLDITLRAGASIEGLVSFPDGSPAVGAEIQASPAGAPRRGGGRAAAMAPGRETAHADDDGRFVLRGLDPLREMSLSASLEGDTSATRVVKPGGEPVALTLAVKGRISGRVLGAEDLAETVRILCEGAPEGSGSTDADADGAFEVRGLTTGTYSCTAIAGELADGSAGGIAVTEGQTSSTSIRLSPRIRQEVIVLSHATGAPIEGANVQPSRADRPQVTGSDGRASVVLPPIAPGMAAETELRTWAPGHEQVTLPLPQPRPALLEIRMRSELVVRGIVLDPEGLGAGGVVVRSTMPGGAVTGPDGRFELSIARSGATELVAERVIGTGIESASLRVEVPAAGLDGVEMRLERAQTGSLLVLAMDGGGAAVGASIYVQHESLPSRSDVADARSGPSVSSQGLGGSGATDLEGSFLAKGLRAGEYRIYAGRAGETTLRFAGSATVQSSAQAQATVLIPDGAMVRGIVTFGGMPVEGASLTAHPPGSGDPWQRGMAGATVSGAGGRFELGPFPEGMASVGLRAAPPPGLSGARSVSAEAVPGGASVTISLDGVTISGKVMSAGEPVAGASVAARQPGRGPGEDARTAPDGSFAIDGLEPATPHDVSATLPGRSPAARSVTTPARGVLDVGILEMGGAEALRGTAHHHDGTPLGSFRIWLARADGTRLPSAEVRVAADGTWSTPAPSDEPLQYRGAARASSDASGSTTPGEPLALVFARGASLTLEIVTPDGRPVQGATATLVSWEGRVADDHLLLSRLLSPRGTLGLSDEQGMLQLEFLRPGASVLRIERQGSSASLSVTLVEGQHSQSRVNLP